MYIEMGMARLPAESKPALLPLLLKNLPNRPAGQRQSLLRLALDIAAWCVLPAPRADSRQTGR